MNYLNSCFPFVSKHFRDNAPHISSKISLITCDFFRFMYYSDWGRYPRIERATLAGRDATPLITSQVGWPNGLTIDFEDDKMYWADALL